jgi:soluble lytic murein transglycosylase
MAEQITSQVEIDFQAIFGGVKNKQDFDRAVFDAFNKVIEGAAQQVKTPQFEIPIDIKLSKDQTLHGNMADTLRNVVNNNIHAIEAVLNDAVKGKKISFDQEKYLHLFTQVFENAADALSALNTSQYDKAAQELADKLRKGEVTLEQALKTSPATVDALKTRLHSLEEQNKLLARMKRELAQGYAGLRVKTETPKGALLDDGEEPVTYKQPSLIVPTLERFIKETQQERKLLQTLLDEKIQTKRVRDQIREKNRQDIGTSVLDPILVKSNNKRRGLQRGDLDYSKIPEGFDYPAAISELSRRKSHQDELLGEALTPKEVSGRQREIQRLNEQMAELRRRQSAAKRSVPDARREYTRNAYQSMLDDQGSFKLDGFSEATDFRAIREEMLTLERDLRSSLKNKPTPTQADKLNRDLLRLQEQALILANQKSRIKGNSLAKGVEDYTLQGQAFEASALNILGISDSEALRSASTGDRQWQATTAFETLSRARQKAIIKALRGANSNYQSAWNNTPINETDARGQHEASTGFIQDLLSAVEARDKTIRQGAEAVDSTTVVKRKEAERLKTLYESQINTPGHDAVEADKVLKKAIATARASMHAARTDEGMTASRDLLKQLKDIQAEIEQRANTTRADKTNARVQELETYLNKTFDALVSTSVTSDEQLKQLLGRLKPGAKLGRMTRELASLRGEVGTDSPAMQELEAVVSLLKESLAGNKSKEKQADKAKTIQNLDALIADFNADLAQQTYGSPEFKETVKALRTAISKRFEGDRKVRRDELAKLTQTVLDAAPTSKDKARELLLAAFQNRRDLSQDQATRLLNRARSQAERIPDAEGYALSGRISRVQERFDRRFQQPTLADLNTRIEQGLAALQGTGTMREFQLLAGGVTRDVRKRFRLNQDDGQQRQTLLDISAQFDRVQKEVKASGNSQQIKELREVIRKAKDNSDEASLELVKSSLTRIKALLKEQIKAEQGSNPERLAQFKAVTQELAQYTRQISRTRLAEQRNSALYQQGRSAAQAARDEPMRIGAGDRDAAIYYYENLRRENRQRVLAGNLSPAEMQAIGRQTEVATRNIGLLRREINNTLSPLHQAKLAITAFFRYAGVYGAGFAAVNAIRDLVSETLRLDKAFRSIQAVSQATAQEMAGVEEAIKGTATSTQFSTQQVAEAAQILAQAGVESKDLPKVLDSVARFASATASDLTLAADVLTSLREVFTEFGDTFKDSRLADALTNAVNISKLNVQDLQVITSLGAQTAKSMGVNADQFLAAAATLSNVGIRKSTVGTGLRQAMLEILNPDAQTLAFLKERYAKIGEALSEEAIKARYHSFQTAQDPMSAAFGELRRIGVSGSARYDFKRVVDIRAENVLLPLMDSLETYQQNIAKIAQSGSAAKGADVQMQAFLNTWGRLSSEVASLAHTLVSAALPPLTGFTNLLADFAKNATDAGNAWKRMFHVGGEDDLRPRIEADAAKLEAARTPYDKTEAGTKAYDVNASETNISKLQTELSALLGNDASNSPDVFRTLQALATKEQGSTEQADLFTRLETLTRNKFNEEQKRTLQLSSQALSDVIGKTQGSRENVRDEAKTAFDGLMPQKDMQEAVKAAYYQTKSGLPAKAPETLNELATQIEGILSFYDRVFELSKKAAKSFEGDKQLARAVEGSVPLTLAELRNPDAMTLDIQRMAAAGDEDGLAMLRGRLDNTPKQLEQSRSVIEQAFARVSPSLQKVIKTEDLAATQAPAILQQLEDAVKTAQQVNQGKAETKKTDARKKDKDAFTTQYIGQVQSNSGIEDLRTSHERLRISTEASLAKLATELDAAKQRADSSNEQVEIEQRQLSLKKALQDSSKELMQRELALMVKVDRIKKNPYTVAAEDIGSDYGVGGLVSAVMQTESSNNPNSRSRKGALGLMQLMPSTAEDVAKQLGIRGYSPDQLIRDPLLNIRLGSKYLSDQIKHFSANTNALTEDELKLALAAYNAGPNSIDNAVRKHGNSFEAVRPHLLEETRGYVDKVVASLGPNIVGRYIPPLKPDDKINHFLNTGMQGGPDSPAFKLSEQYYKTRSESEASTRKAELEIAQTQRRNESEGMQREINVKQEELKRIEQELSLATKGLDAQKSNQLAEQVRQKQDEINRLTRDKAKFDRNAADPSFNRDLDLAYSNQASANSTQYEARRRDILREDASKTLRIEGQNKEDLLVNIKQRSTLGDLSGANAAIDQLIQKQELLRKAYREREDATDGITEAEKAQNEAVRKSKDELEIYTLRVNALTQALTVLDEKLKERYEKPLEQRAADAYSQARGYVPTQDEQRDTLLRERSLDRGKIAAREQTLSELKTQRDHAPAAIQAEYTPKITAITSELEQLTEAVAGINAQLYELDVTPLQALGDVSLNNVVAGLNGLEYSAKNLHRTIESHFVAGIDNAITGLVDFATNGEKARQSAESLRQAIIAVNQAKLDYADIVLDRPRAYSEAVQMADSKRVQARADLLARGASGQQLAASQASEGIMRSQVISQAESAQREREAAAAKTLKEQEKARREQASRSGVWGTLKTAAADMGQAVLGDVLKSTVLDGVKNVLGMGARGEAKTKPLFVHVTNQDEATSAAESGTNDTESLTDLKDSLSKPVGSLSDRLSGLFKDMTGSLSSFGNNLASGFAALGSSTGSKVGSGLGALGSLFGVVEKIAGLVGKSGGGSSEFTNSMSSLFGGADASKISSGLSMGGSPSSTSLLGGASGSGGSWSSWLSGGGGDSGSGFASGLFDSVSSGFGGLSDSVSSGLGFSSGGHVRGPGTPTSDSIPANLSDGEYVVNARATQAFGVQNLDRINQGLLDSRGESPQKAMYVELTNPADITQTTGSEFDPQELVTDLKDGIAKPMDEFSDKLTGSFSTVSTSLDGFGDTLQNISSRMSSGGSSEMGGLQTAMGLLNNIAGIAGGVGVIGGFSTGGYVRGPGTATSDSIPARLSDGEFVVNARATQAFGVHNLERINQFRFANGGFVNKFRPPELYANPTRPDSGYNYSGPAKEAATLVQVIDQRKAGSPEIETQRSRDGNNREVIRMLVREEVKTAVDTGVLDKSLRANFGLRRAGTQR